MERKVLWKAASVSVLSVPLFLIIDGKLSSQWMLLVYGMSRVMERKNPVAPNPTNKFAGSERHIVRMPWNSIWWDTWLAPHWAGSCVQWWTNCFFSPSLPPSHPLLKKLTWIWGLCFLTWKAPHRHAWHRWFEFWVTALNLQAPQSPHRPQSSARCERGGLVFDLLSQCLL